MPSTVSDVVFSEPSGRTIATVQLAGSLVFAGIYLYSWVRTGARTSSWPLIMTTGFALSGIAESLPKGRGRTAGLLRITSVLAFLCALAALQAPELVLGR
jgi:hypothetical protein